MDRGAGTRRHPRLRQGGMTIVTNKYPHNWAYHPAWSRLAVERHPACARRPIHAVDRAGLNKLLGGLMIRSGARSIPAIPWFGAPSFDIKYDPEAAKLLAERRPAPAKAEDQDRHRPRAGQMLPLPMNEYVQENLNAVGFDAQFEGHGMECAGELPFQLVDGRGRHQGNVNGINISRATVDPYSAFMGFLSLGLRAAGRRPIGAC